MVIKCKCIKDKNVYACEHRKYTYCKECLKEVYVCEFCNYKYCDDCSNDSCEYCDHNRTEQFDCPKCFTVYDELDICICESHFCEDIVQHNIFYCTDCEEFIYSEEFISPEDVKIHRKHLIEKDAHKVKEICITKYHELKKSYYF